MKCVICRTGETRPATTTITLERCGATTVFKGVPAEVCSTCGEQYVDEATTRRLLEQAEGAQKAGVEVQVRSYAA